MLKKINNGSIKKIKNYFLKNQKSHLDFLDFLKINAIENTPKNNK